jgi:hypothetical protein
MLTVTSEPRLKEIVIGELDTSVYGGVILYHSSQSSILRIRCYFSGYPPGGPLLVSFRKAYVCMTRQFKSDLVQACPYKSM